MRPSEKLALRGVQLLSPMKGISGAADKWSLLIGAVELGQSGKTDEYDASISLDISSCFLACSYSKTHEPKDSSFFLFSHTQATKNGERVKTAPLSANAHHVILPETRRCERGPRGPREKSGRGVAARRLKELQQCATLRKTSPLVPGYVEDPSRASPARIGTRTRPGTTLEKALTRALTGSTSSVGRVLLCIFNATRLVDTILNGHDHADLFLDPSRASKFDVGQPPDFLLFR